MSISSLKQYGFPGPCPHRLVWGRAQLSHAPGPKGARYGLDLGTFRRISRGGGRKNPCAKWLVMALGRRLLSGNKSSIKEISSSTNQLHSVDFDAHNCCEWSRSTSRDTSLRCHKRRNHKTLIPLNSFPNGPSRPPLSIGGELWTKLILLKKSIL